jgi:hypothetical protein
MDRMEPAYNRASSIRNTPFCSFLMVLQNNQAWEKSHCAVVCIQCSASQHSSLFLVLCRVECGGRQVLSQTAFSLFLTRQLASHHSGQIPKTTVLYDTPSKFQERYVLNTCMRGQKLSGPWYLTVLQDPGSIRVKDVLVPPGRHGVLLSAILKGTHSQDFHSLVSTLIASFKH